MKTQEIIKNSKCTSFNKINPIFSRNYEDLRNELYELFKIKGLHKSVPNFFGMIGDMVARNFEIF